MKTLLTINDFQNGTKFLDQQNQIFIVVSQDTTGLERDIVYIQKMDGSEIFTPEQVKDHFRRNIYTSKIQALWSFNIEKTVKQIIDI